MGASSAQTISHNMVNQPLTVIASHRYSNCGSSIRYYLNPVQCRVGNENEISETKSLEITQDGSVIYINNQHDDSVFGRIIDMQGKVVNEIQSSSSSFQIETNNLTGGLYILEITNGKDALKEKIIIR